MKQPKEKYGLFTAVTMIIGICIGSGIFFKSDNILEYTGGSIFLGVVVFAIAALAIIFGGLCFGELASRTNTPGGTVTYMDEFCGKRSACGLGWFQIFIYYPTLAVVVSWVVGIYTCILFNLENTIAQQITIGFAFCCICFLYNTFSPKFGGAFQNATTIIKMVPLVLLAVTGLIFGDPIGGLSNISPATFTGVSWIAAVGPIAFSYDGWTISTSIAHEIKDSKKNLSRALIIAPLAILCLYVLYFVGITSYVGAEQVMALGDAHVEYAAANLFGPTFAKVVTIFVIISVMGTVNGIILGFIRMPYSMSLRENMMPFSKKLSTLSDKYDIPVNASLFAFALCVFWYVVHFLTLKFALLPNSDISEISITISYLLYIPLYYQVFKLYRNGEIKSFWRGVLCPIFALVGSIFILSGGMQNPLFFIYFAICALVVILSQVYYSSKAKLINVKK
ncbi:MAG: APC family permease [Oscillospiraceae bacterium]